MVEWYIKVWRQYADFKGRARRKEYFFFVLANAIVGMSLSLAGNYIGFVFKILYGLYVLLAVVPSVAVSVRRLHDTHRSGWWYLLALIPVVGWIILFIFFIEEGDWESNEYGPSPKQEDFQHDIE